MRDCAFNESCKHSGRCKKKCGGYPPMSLEARVAFAKFYSKKFGQLYISQMSKAVRDEIERTKEKKGVIIEEKKEEVQK